MLFLEQNPRNWRFSKRQVFWVLWQFMLLTQLYFKNSRQLLTKRIKPKRKKERESAKITKCELETLDFKGSTSGSWISEKTLSPSIKDQVCALIFKYLQRNRWVNRRGNDREESKGWVWGKAMLEYICGHWGELRETNGRLRPPHGCRSISFLSNQTEIY